MNHDFSDKLQSFIDKESSLDAAYKIIDLACKSGFSYNNFQEVFDKFFEEIREFNHEVKNGANEKAGLELGDILFCVITLAWWLNLNPDKCLKLTCQKFVSRFRLMESCTTKLIEEHSTEELADLWKQAKESLKAEKK